MANGRDAKEIKRIRNEALFALRVLYPAALQADRLMRSLLPLFPTLDFDTFKRDLHYLVEKGYIERIKTDRDDNGDLTPWKHRWFRLTTQGMEVAEHCITDPALED